ncbi:response regulator [Kiloniella laminariae]|uniref:Response regulator n=1 Tax=Kiloniella laminariae TaxID=454162 RepID=A0ABT4LP77_9PROT|nr:response regulator [Kiloniella laminariae]MCZ4282940.1 response regulator [Kiloniella laminariae]
MSEKMIYLVDDDAAVREGLTLLLETIGMKVQGFPDPFSFLDKLAALAPGCIILDIRMPGLSGLKLQERLVAANSDWPIIVISGHGDINACRQAFRNGAVDFLSKPIDEQDLIDAIQKAHAQLDRHENQLAEITENRDLLDQLSSREREILNMITQGWTTKEIALSLALSPRTVESHRKNIATKLKTTSVAEMTRIVLESAPATS